MPENLDSIKKLCEGLSYIEKNQLRDYLNDLIVHDSEVAKIAPLTDAEKRQSRRFDVDIAGTCISLRDTTRNGGKRFNVRIVDISREGVRFFSRTRINQRDACIIQFRHNKLGYKKIYVEIMRVREHIRGKEIEYEVGGLALDPAKVEMLLVTLERQRLIEQKMAMKNNFRILALTHQTFSTNITSLIKDGFSIKEIQNRDRLMPEVLDRNYDLLILDADVLGSELGTSIQTVKRFRPDQIILVIATYTSHYHEQVELEAVYEIIERKSSQLELSFKIDRALRFLSASDWNSLIKTKLRIVLFSDDEILINMIDEELKKLRFLTILCQVRIPFQRFIKDQSLLNFDFAIFDVQRYLKMDFIKMNGLLEAASIPVFATDYNEQKRKIALRNKFDEFLNLPIGPEMFEDLLQRTYQRKIWKIR